MLAVAAASEQPNVMKLPALLVAAWVIVQAQTPAPTPTTLKAAYQGLFRIGAAINQAQFEERDQRGTPIITSQFNSISPENVLKWGPIHPTKDSYNFGPADSYVAFGEKY